jgi:hypothetical protein
MVGSGDNFSVPEQRIARREVCQCRESTKRDLHQLWALSTGRFFGGRGMNQILIKTYTFLRLGSSLFRTLRKHFGPFFFLLDLPSTFLTLPMWSAIVPEMEVAIKGRSDHSAEFIDMETHLFRENREAKMIVAEKFHMKVQSSPPQTRL